MDLDFDRKESAGYLVNWAGRLFVRAIERRLTGGNAGPMPVFFALRDGGALSQRDLARWAVVEQPTMANTLNRMERDGLIVRSPDPTDGRSMLISLSPLGRERAKQAMESAFAVNKLALSGLSAKERTALFAMLRKVIEKLETDSSESPPRIR